MKLFLYSVHDKLMGYVDPFVSSSDDVATRSFETACMQPNSNFAYHPTDYTLCLVGEFDSKTGSISPIEPTPIARATDFLIKESE